MWIRFVAIEAVGAGALNFVEKLVSAVKYRIIYAL